jgi:hypothetical protein
MVEVVLPAGATIAAFVMSVISWYGMLRTGYLAIYHDAHARNHIGANRISIETELDRQQARFKDFQKRWLIFSKELPLELYQRLWGPATCTNVQGLFQNIRERSEEINKKVDSWHLLSETDAAKEKKRFFRLSTSKNSLKDANFVIAQEEYLVGCLGKLKTDIDVAEDAANRGYHIARGLSGSYKDVAEEDIHSLIVGYLLVGLANRWRGDVELFADSLLQIRPDYFVELELGEISGTAPIRPQGDGHTARTAQAISVVQTAAAERLKLTMLAGPKRRQHLNPVRVSIEKLKDPPSTSLADSFTAFQRFLQDRNPCNYRADNATHIHIRESSFPHQASSHSRLPLRSISSPDHDPPVFFRSQRQEEELSKYRAAFELSQTYLIFMRTKWLRSLCSCHVRYGRVTDPPEYEFSLSVADDEHMPYPSADAHKPPPWCQNTRTTGLDPNLRLGMLLVEITLGVCVAPNNNNPYGGRRVYLVGADNQRTPCTYEKLRGRLRDLSAEEIGRGAIRRTAGYAAAIMHCFDNPAPDPALADGTRNPLREFYLNVVVK